APMGVYSVLGKQDYGDYYKWDSAKDKVANLERLKSLQADLGWQLLLNENIILERGEDKIAVLGVENWGAQRKFPKFGDLEMARKGAEDIPFKILLSHDPSHWEAKVLPQYKDIDLTLSGHTH